MHITHTLRGMMFSGDQVLPYALRPFIYMPCSISFFKTLLVKRTILAFVYIFFVFKISSSCAQKLPMSRFETNPNTTATYSEVISYYARLDTLYPQAKLISAGTSDAGLPIHTFVIDNSATFDPYSDINANKAVFFVNNGIHPGEPAGIDASMLWAKELLTNHAQNSTLLDSMIIVIIPVYNIGGMLNRGQSRPNQNGPLEYGFRGNAKNLDLNRDFIKMDSKNAQSFARIFNDWSPDFFIDTHPSNGAD